MISPPGVGCVTKYGHTAQTGVQELIEVENEGTLFSAGNGNLKDGEQGRCTGFLFN